MSSDSEFERFLQEVGTCKLNVYSWRVLCNRQSFLVLSISYSQDLLFSAVMKTELPFKSLDLMCVCVCVGVMTHSLQL